jgi:hypothetical protein
MEFCITPVSSSEWSVVDSEQGRDFFPALFVCWPSGNLTSGATAGTYTVWLRGYASSVAGDPAYVGLAEEMVTVTCAGYFGHPPQKMGDSG